MFDAIDSENVGLQWEPCHQMVSLIDPMPQLRKWVDKIFSVHGKDATILWDVVREHGDSKPVFQVGSCESGEIVFTVGFFSPPAGKLISGQK